MDVVEKHFHWCFFSPSQKQKFDETKENYVKRFLLWEICNTSDIIKVFLLQMKIN